MGKFLNYLCEVEDEGEVLNLPSIVIGQKVLIGKFKNRTAIVTGFDTDDRGQPIIITSKGRVQLFKPRIVKLFPPTT